MMAAEHVLKEYEGAQGKKEVVPWTKPFRSVSITAVDI